MSPRRRTGLPPVIGAKTLQRMSIPRLLRVSDAAAADARKASVVLAEAKECLAGSREALDAYQSGLLRPKGGTR
jgi:hypothetical protein